MLSMARVCRSGIIGGEYRIGSHGQRKRVSESEGGWGESWVLVAVVEVVHVEPEVNVEVVGDVDIVGGSTIYGMLEARRDCSPRGGSAAEVGHFARDK
jgi:hypothetical protein